MHEPAAKPVRKVAHAVSITITVFIFTMAFVMAAKPAEGKVAARAVRAGQSTADDYQSFNQARRGLREAKPRYQIGSFQGATPSFSSIQTIANSAPNINVWYGLNQSFGQIGNPQKWVNILGNVSDPNIVDSSCPLSPLSYSLNSGPQVCLSVGPDNRRLEWAGDFNVDIDRALLLTGNNQVEIKQNDVVIETVQVNYVSGKVWPLPYAINWSSVSNVQDVAQVVDGSWSVSNDGLTTDIIGYDRLVAIGGVTWTDYEVLVPITVHSVNSGGNPPGVGILMRWQGHTNDPIICSQPKCGYIPNGNIGWFRFRNGVNDVNLEFFGPAASIDFPSFSLNTTYWFKIRVETKPGGESEYSLKVWTGPSEPQGWNLSVQEDPDNLPTGSFLLLAHHADATFGNVSVVPVNGNLLTVNKNGNGEVMLDPAGGEYGQGTVVTLTPQSDPGWVFTGWSGDLTGNSNPGQLVMNGNKNVTATFAEAEEKYTITTNVVGQGSVEKVPEGPYTAGQMVTLTAIPQQSWVFHNWTGDINGMNSPVQVTINGNINVTAIFYQQQVLIPVIDKP